LTNSSSRYACQVEFVKRVDLILAFGIFRVFHAFRGQLVSFLGLRVFAWEIIPGTRLPDQPEYFTYRQSARTLIPGGIQVRRHVPGRGLNENETSVLLVPELRLGNYMRKLQLLP
jgi:hypothetical protein